MCPAIFKGRCQQKYSLYTNVFVYYECVYLQFMHMHLSIYKHANIYRCIFCVLCLQGFYTLLTYFNEFINYESWSRAGRRFISMPSDFCAVSFACECSHQKKSLPEFMTFIAADCSKKQLFSDSQPDKAQDELPAHTYAWSGEMVKGFHIKCLQLIKTRTERKRSN